MYFDSFGDHDIPQILQDTKIFKGLLKHIFSTHWGIFVYHLFYV